MPFRIAWCVAIIFGAVVAESGAVATGT